MRGIWGQVSGALLFGVRLWASVVLALFLAFWLQLDNPFWAATSAAIVCQPSLGASLRKASFRLVGTVIGAAVLVVLIACFPQSRYGLIIALALWCGVCGFAATVLRNFAGYGAALAGYTTVIIASDAIPDPSQAFLLAVARATEIGLGIVCAGLVLSLTDMGTAKRRAAVALSTLAGEIWDGVLATLHEAGSPMRDSSPYRRALVERCIALSALLDEAVGESSGITARSGVLQSAADGLFDALGEWRTIAGHLESVPPARAGQDARAALDALPAGFGSRFADLPSGEAAGLGTECREMAAMLLARPVETPAERLIVDRTAYLLAGLHRALDGVTLLGSHGPPAIVHYHAQLRTPDLLPALVNALRAIFVVLSTSLFWIVTAWPSGLSAVLFASIVVILLSPRGDDAFGGAIGFWVGTMATAGLAAVANFALLPGLESFGSLALVLALFLIPTAALSAQDWRKSTFVALCTNFVPLLSPSNVQSYSPAKFYNLAIAIGVGVGFGILALALVPQLSPRLRARRLMVLSLRDLRRIAAGRQGVMSITEWQGLIYGRLAVLPKVATPLQRGQLVAALWVGAEILRVRALEQAYAPGLAGMVAPVIASIAGGDIGGAEAALSEAGRQLTGLPEVDLATAPVMRMRAALLGLREALSRHAEFFGSLASGGTGALR